MAEPEPEGGHPHGSLYRVAGALTITRAATTEREIAALAQNVLMVATYWMSWQRISGRLPAAQDADGIADTRLAQAAYQAMALIAPYLHGDARELIEHLGADYLRLSN